MILAALLLIACDPAPYGSATKPSQAKETTTVSTAPHQTAPFFPPIDSNVPQDKKTATFALG